MSVVLWYGGYLLAGVCLFATVFLFFYNKIPAVIRYFANTKQQPAKAAKAYRGAATAKSGVTQRKTKRYVTQEVEPTEIIDIAAAGMQGDESTEVLAATILLDNPNRVIQGVTEVLDATDILPGL